MTKHGLFLLLALFFSIHVSAHGQDSLCVKADSMAVKPVEGKRKRDMFHAIGHAFTKVFRGFNELDTNYIEPQHYDYTVMLQNTNTFEEYTIESKSGQRFSFAPDWSAKVGPYAAWRWLFLGYSFDVKHLEKSNRKTEFDLSFYSSMLGIDLYYRKSGDDFRITKATIKDAVDKYILRDVPFGGLNVSIKGFDIYYIFNHNKFSYPAAFSQTNRQKRSCGSPLLGIGYTAHSLSLDYEALKTVVNNSLGGTSGGSGANGVEIDEDLCFKNVKYEAYSVSGGYAYNWVMARNCLFSASLSVAMAYKKSKSDDTKHNGFSLKDFSFNNFNLDGIGRFGFVWNNDKYFAGASTVLHAYNYRKSKFSTNNYFASLNVYVGMNLGLKRKYKKNVKQ